MDVLEFVISIVAMVLIAVTCWILLLRKGKKPKPAYSSEKYDLGELSSIAESMKDRIDVLESILDSEVPDWREQNEHGPQ